MVKMIPKNAYYHLLTSWSESYILTAVRNKTASHVATEHQNKNWIPEDLTPFIFDKINSASAPICTLIYEIHWSTYFT